MARDSEGYNKTWFVVKALEASSVLAIDAGGQIVLGGPLLVLECFKLGNYDSISHLSFSVLRVDVPVRRPYKVPRSAPKLRKGGVVLATIAVHPPLDLWDGSSDLNQQRLHLRIARLGENNRAD